MSFFEMNGTIGGLKQLTERFRKEEERNHLDGRMLSEIVSFLDEESTDLSVLTEVFRCLRNACAGCLRNQILIGQESKVIQTTGQVLKRLITVEDSDEKYLCMSCGIQLLGNLVTGCPDNQEKVRQSVWNDFRSLVQMNHEKVRNYTCMVLYNCLNAELTSYMYSTDHGRELVGAVLTFIAESEHSEWGMYVAQTLVRRGETIPAIYHHLDRIQRIVLLDIMLENQNSLTIDTVVFLADQFVDCAHMILGLSQTHIAEKLEPRIATRILSLLCDASASPEYRLLLDMDKLLECTVNLLHGIHLIGKTDDNNFSTASKLDSSGELEHPAFGLRKDLVRLIGNLCYRHRVNQDKVRELGGVPLLLEQSVIDHRNPYITQWSVLAVRNLCENNHENQSVIAEMSLQGVSNRVDMLREFGVDAYQEGGKVKIRRVEEH